MRLIDANEFYAQLEEIRMDYIEEDTQSSDFAANVIETVQDEYLAKSTTVDAVEVVRCEQCKSNDRTDDDKRRGIVWCKKICRYMKVDGFCSEGERKDNG